MRAYKTKKPSAAKHAYMNATTSLCCCIRLCTVTLTTTFNRLDTHTSATMRHKSKTEIARACIRGIARPGANTQKKYVFFVVVAVSAAAAVAVALLVNWRSIFFFFVLSRNGNDDVRFGCRLLPLLLMFAILPVLLLLDLNAVIHLFLCVHCTYYVYIALQPIRRLKDFFFDGLNNNNKRKTHSRRSLSSTLFQMENGGAHVYADVTIVMKRLALLSHTTELMQTDETMILNMNWVIQ